MPEPAKNQPTSAWLLLLMAPLFMATNPVIGKAAVDIVPPIALSFWRWLIAFLILLPFAWRGLSDHSQVLWQHRWLILLLGALGMGVCGVFVYIALHTTTSINTGLIYAASPVLILLINKQLNKQTIDTWQLLGVALAIIGVVMILLQGDIRRIVSLTFTIGDWWVVLAVIAWAFYSVLLKSNSLSSIGTLSLFAAIALAGTLVQFPFFIWESWRYGLPEMNIEAILSIFAVAIISSVLAFGSYQAGIVRVGPARAGPFMYLMPVYGSALSVLLLNEAFEIYHATGLLLVVAGVILSTAFRPASANR